MRIAEVEELKSGDIIFSFANIKNYYGQQVNTFYVYEVSHIDKVGHNITMRILYENNEKIGTTYATVYYPSFDSVSHIDPSYAEFSCMSKDIDEAFKACNEYLSSMVNRIERQRENMKALKNQYTLIAECLYQ